MPLLLNNAPNYVYYLLYDKPELRDLMLDYASKKD
jgi:hypothetical protein